MIGEGESMESYRVGTVVALNPTYGVSFQGSDKASETSGSNDYLSVSVNPTYQFIDQSCSRSQTVLSDSSLDEHTGGISIPGGTKRSRAVFTNPNSPNLLCDTSTSFLSNSAPPVSYRNMPSERSSSSISSDGGEQSQSPSQTTGNSPYSYARHSTGRGRTTSNGSTHSEKRTQPYFISHKIDEECEETDSGKGSSSATSTIGSNRAKNYLTSATTRQNGSYSLPNSSLYQKSYSCEDDILKFDIILCLFAVLTIIISIVAIALCIVVKTKGTQVTNTDGTPTNIVIIGGTIPPTTGPINKTSSCNCTIGPHDNFTLPNSLLQKLKQIKLELARLKSQKPDILSKSRDLLHNLLSQIKAINNSIEKIKPFANQPRSPHLTGINLPSSFSINIIDRCTITKSGTADVDTPENFNSANAPGPLTIINSEGIVVDFVCQTFHASNLPINTSTSIVRRTVSGQTIYNPNNIIEVFKKSNFICQCFNFGTSSVKCRYFATRCPFEYRSVNTTLHT